jgi:catechol 2,3-dioxygenase-like lactoylglutathione lyase family enzyme
MEQRYDRAVEDLGNIVGLEHVNVRIPDQQTSTAFYVSALGLTRDPYLMTGTDNMWINIGRSQFHLPTGDPQVVRGHVGLVLPEREALLRRLAAARKLMDGTGFAYRERNAFVEVTSPWGNRLRCYTPEARFGRITLGMPYVELDAPPGSIAAIARFYREMLDAPAVIAEDEHGRHARISVGAGQELIYRESDGPLAAYDGHHIQIYIHDFSGPHHRLSERGLITEESDQHQYRFEQIVDPASGKALFTIEHEVRSFRHPLYNRPLVNRNPEQTNTNYAPGHDGAVWSMAHQD